MSLLVIACGSSQREVSKVKYTHVQCTDCGVETGEEQRFELPDAERGVPKTTPSGYDPEPTCNLVAESIVSLELGNYAEPEERAPKVAHEEKRCAQLRLSREDRQCVVDSTDRASIAYCAPALFPKDQQFVALTIDQCAEIANRMRAQVENISKGDPSNKAMYDRLLGAAIEACRGDRWHQEMAQCAQSYVPVYSQNCMYVQPYGMYKRLERRLEKARKS